MGTEKVTLSTTPFSILNYDQETGHMYITGAALEEGAWIGAGGSFAYYPRDVIRRHARDFIGVPLYCNHGYEIGEVLDARPTPLGFEIDAVIKHQDTIQSVIRGDMSGLSIGATIIFNERRVVTRLEDFAEISVVKNPACKTCRIDPGRFVKDRVTMSEDTSDKEVAAFKELYAAAETFSAAKAKLSAVVLDAVGTPTNETDQITASGETEDDNEENQMSEEELKEGVAEGTEAGADEVKTEEPVVETEGEAVTEEVEGEGEAEGEGEEEEVEETVTLSAFNELKEQVDALAASNEAKDVEIAKMTATLSAYETDAEAKEASEKATLMAGILDVAPNANKEVLEGMSVVQLSAYKETAEDLASPVIGNEKQSKQDVTLSAPVVDEKEQRILGIINHLKEQQH